MHGLVEREREMATVEALLAHGGSVVTIEGGAGIGKTSLLHAACHLAEHAGQEVFRAAGSELEEGFAFGVVRQLFERVLSTADGPEGEALLAGPASAARRLLFAEVGEQLDYDRSFAVLHGLYWLAANLSARRPLVIAVDDAHWADGSSLRWLAYLSRRLDGLPLTLMITLRPGERASREPPLLALRADPAVVVRPALLSERGVSSLLRQVDDDVGDGLCTAVKRVSGGNPFYIRELLRGVEFEGRALSQLDPHEVLAQAGHTITDQVAGRVRNVDAKALVLAQALAVLGDGCELRDAAAVAKIESEGAARLADRLVRLEVLEGDDPPRFLHPIVREAVEASMGTDERDKMRRAAALLLFTGGAPPGQVAAHLAGVRSTGDGWVVARLREAALEAMASGAPQAAADLLGRALAEPPAPAERIAVLRELARAEATAGRETACARLEQALSLTADPRERAEVALEVAETYAGLFRWVDAVDAIDRALSELGGTAPRLVARLEGELVVAGLHDARRASRVAAVLERLSSRGLSGVSGEPVAVARGMAALLAGQPTGDFVSALEETLTRATPRAENWDTRAALLWSLVAAERFEAVAAALEPMLTEVSHSGSARGLVAVYSTLGLLKLRLGALPEADSGARVALKVLQENDFAPGLAFAATVLADIAVEAGELSEAQALLELLSQDISPAGVGTVLIPAARGRLHLAQGQYPEALADFETCTAMFSAEVWGMEIRDVGYLHARSGSALALLQLSARQRARELAEAELADVQAFGGARAIGIATRVTGLVLGGAEGLELLSRSVATLRESPATLERGRSLIEFGAALRRAGQRTAAREALAEGLDLAARCGARPLGARAREELKAAGARPRREWRRGVEALTPSELRVARLAADGQSNREIAQGLYITLKTVEGHLARVYDKLGIAGRRELRARMEREKTRVPTP